VSEADRAGWERAVVALLVATFCTSAASLAGVTALGKQVYDLTHRELDLGWVGLAEFAPAALLVLVTGAVADRHDRRRVAAVGVAGEALAAIALAVYAAGDPTAVEPIFFVVFAFGVSRAFVAPALRALPADIVDADRLPWLVARFSATWQLAIIVGPVLAGGLYAVDPTLPYVAMALLLFTGAVAVSLIPTHVTRPVDAVDSVNSVVSLDMPELEAGVEPAMGHGAAAPSGRAGLHEALEGLRFIRRNPILLGAISLDLFAVLFGGAVALLPAIAEDRLQVDSVGLGWLRAAGGIGAAIVTIGLARRPLQHRVGPTLFVAVAVFGVTTIVLGVTRSFLVAFVAMAVLSGADAVSVFIRATLVPLVTPMDKRGRVLAVENVFIGASNELGAFESGVAGELLGTSGAVVLGGSATLAVAAVWSVVFPELRSVDRFPKGEGAARAPQPLERHD
jgi:MFS family permease